MFSRKSYKLNQVVLILLANYAGVFAWGLFAPIFALIVLARGGDAADVGIIWGGYTLLTGLSMLLFGRIEDSRHNTKLLLVVGTLLLIVASLTLLIISSQTGLIIAQFIFGIGFGMSMPALKAIYGKLVDKGREAGEWAMMDGGNMLIMSAAALIGGIVFQYVSQGAIYILMSVSFAVSAILYIAVISANYSN